MSRPELPYLAAGAVSIVGGARRANGWPATGGRVIIATIVLVIVASASNNSKIAPLVHAFGILLLLVAVMATVNAELTSKKKGKK
jgi:hypothetical protein